MEGNEISEDKWIVEAQQGNEAAVELLIRHTYSDVYRFIRWKIHNDELAWDLAQTVYEKHGPSSTGIKMNTEAFGLG